MAASPAARLADTPATIAGGTALHSYTISRGFAGPRARAGSSANEDRRILSNEMVAMLSIGCCKETQCRACWGRIFMEQSRA